MAEDLICSSHNMKIANMSGSVTFMCPKCGKGKIVRSRHAREIAAKYTCPSCGFTGPN